MRRKAYELFRCTSLLNHKSYIGSDLRKIAVHKFLMTTVRQVYKYVLWEGSRKFDYSKTVKIAYLLDENDWSSFQRYTMDVFIENDGSPRIYLYWLDNLPVKIFNSLSAALGFMEMMLNTANAYPGGTTLSPFDRFQHPCSLRCIDGYTQPECFVQRAANLHKSEVCSLQQMSAFVFANKHHLYNGDISDSEETRFPSQLLSITGTCTIEGVGYDREQECPELVREYPTRFSIFDDLPTGRSEPVRMIYSSRDIPALEAYIAIGIIVVLLVLVLYFAYYAY